MNLEIHLTCWACGAPLLFAEPAELAHQREAKIVGRCTDPECPRSWSVEVRMVAA